MPEEDRGVRAAYSIGSLMALAVLAALVPLVGAYIAMGWLMGVERFLFGGFLFALYWLGIQKMDKGEFLPALVGSLGGTALAWLLHVLPVLWGAPGMAIGLLLVACALFLLIRGIAAIMVNNAFLLMLTVGAIPVFDGGADYAATAGAILLAATYCGALVWLIGCAAAARRSRTTA